MKVTLQTDNQFGPEGPQSGAAGIAAAFVIDVEGEVFFLCRFDGTEMNCWVPAKMLAYPDHTGNDTTYSSMPPLASAT